MPILLLAIFLKGPAWLRGFVLLCFGGILLFGFLSAVNTIRYASERTVPAHAYTARTHRSHLSR